MGPLVAPAALGTFPSTRQSECPVLLDRHYANRGEQVSHGLAPQPLLKSSCAHDSHSLYVDLCRPFKSCRLFIYSSCLSRSHFVSLIAKAPPFEIIFVSTYVGQARAIPTCATFFACCWWVDVWSISYVDGLRNFSRLDMKILLKIQKWIINVLSMHNK